MSYHGEKLIKQVKENVNSNNLELIYNEFKFIEDSDQIKQSIEIICSLINIVGNYLVSAEKKNRPEDLTIFDTFCCNDFMSEFLQLSTYKYYKINLQLIKTLSFLLINIKNKSTLYYLFSNNLLNKIISKDYSKHDDEFLSYYVNFLKSLSFLLDETSIQLFYIEKYNSFPLVENILKYYNHKDSMIRNVVRNTIMNIFKVKSSKIEEHFSKLPSVLYFVKIVLHLRDICFEIKEEIKNKNKNNNKISYLFDDLYDEMIYIDDLLNLKKEKINYIIMNCLFTLFIIPVLCGSICNENQKLTKEFAVFLLIFFLSNMKNETFKNCLFSILFLDEINSDIESLLKLDVDINDFFINVNEEKKNKNNNEMSFFQFFSEHYSYYFLLTIISNNNIIFTKYGNIYPELKEIMENGKELCDNINYGENYKNYTFEEIIQKLKLLINRYIDNKQLIIMKNYHEYISKGTGLVIGQIIKENINNKEKEELICENCFMFYIRDLFHSLTGNNNINKTLIKNKIKENLLNFVKIPKEDILLLFNILIFLVQNKEVNISNILLKLTNLVNIFDNTKLYGNNIKNIVKKKSTSDEIGIEHKISFNENIFTFNNYYFSMANINVENINNNYKLVEALSNLLNLETPFLPITYQVIYQNIINLTLDENYICHIDINATLVKNIESKYKSILFFIYSLFKNQSKNRECCYDIFYNQWKIYKDLNNKSLLNLIKKNVISSLDILSISNIDNNSDLSDGFEIINNSNLNKNNNDKNIFLKNIKENVCFETNLMIFMLVYDLKKIFKQSNNRNNSIIDDLIKNKFPLDFSSYDFQRGQKYDIDSIDPSKLYKQQILYKIINSKKNKEKSFMKLEIIIYKSFLYFGIRNNNRYVLIFKKIDIKLIKDIKDYNIDGDNCVQLTVDDGNNEYIIIKFDHFKQTKDFRELINEKIKTSINDERLLFSQYFEGLVSRFKNLESHNNKEEDF